MADASRRRLDAVFGALKFKNWDQLAESIGVARQHLAAVRGGKSNVGHELAYKMQNAYGVSSRWLLEGIEPMFVTPPTDDGAVEEVIRTQLRHGGSSTGGLTLFENLGNVTREREEIPVAGDGLRTLSAGQSSPIKWRKYARRATGPATPTSEEGFYLALDKSSAEHLNACQGDYALFLYIDGVFRGYSPEQGEKLICMFACARRNQLCAVEIVDVVPGGRGRQRRRTPPRREYDLEHKDTVGTGYYLRRDRSCAMPKSAEMFAVAVRVERDLLGRAAASEAE